MTPVNTGDDSSRDSAKEGDVASTPLHSKEDLAKDGRLAFSLDVDITTVGVAMTRASAKRVSLLTTALSAMERSIANGVKGAKDGTLATDNDLAEGKQLH
jgi:hypothetical protein